MMTVFCLRCWAENRREDTFCRRCGARLDTRDKEFVAKLIAALGHPEPLTRRRAAWILGELRDRRALAPLIAAVEGSADPDLLEGAVEALGKLGDERAVDALARLLRSSYLSVRLKAVEALRSIGGPRATEAMRSALDDPNVSVREKATRALHELGQVR